MVLLWQPDNSEQPTQSVFVQTVDIVHNNRSICSLVRDAAHSSIKPGKASSNTGQLSLPVKYPGEEGIIGAYTVKTCLFKKTQLLKSLVSTLTSQDN